MPPTVDDLDARARLTRGSSADPIYRAVADALTRRHPGGGTLIDVGCGVGNLWGFVRDQFEHYIGLDAIEYEGFPPAGVFHRLDLDTGRAPLPDGAGDVVAAVETIEHLENPRAFARELVRLCRSGGWVLLTTPNQLSLLSKLTLLFRNEFNAFRASSYPAHLTALLEVDLRRIAAEVGLVDVEIRYTHSGRMPGTSRHFPAWLSRGFPRGLSDNVLVIARKPS